MDTMSSDTSPVLLVFYGGRRGWNGKPLLVHVSLSFSVSAQDMEHPIPQNGDTLVNPLSALGSKGREPFWLWQHPDARAVDYTRQHLPKSAQQGFQER